MDGINLKDVRPNVHNPRSNFDLSFKRRFDFKHGQLIPVLMQPCIPGDKFEVSTEHLLRMAPFVSQVYQKYVVNLDFYFVPSRLLWHDFNNFMTAGYNGKKEYVHPYFTNYSMASNINDVPSTHHHLMNFLDIPNVFMSVTQSQGYHKPYRINCLPFYAYVRVYLDYWLGTGTPLNELYETIVNRDNSLCSAGENFSDFLTLYVRLLTGDPEVDFDKLVLPDGANRFDYMLQCLPRLYPLDYFTMARPNPQLGPVMTIPLTLVSKDQDGSSTFVVAEPETNVVNAHTNSTGVYFTNTANSNQIAISVKDGNNYVPFTVNGSIFNNVASINDFYSAARVQELLNLYGFTGFMPQDTIAAEFGMKSSDSSLQRSEFIYHDHSIVNIGEVFSNNVNVPSDEDSGALTDIAGVGTAIGKDTHISRGFRYNVGSEYGYLVGLVSVYPEAGYTQGMPRHFHYLDRFDYPHPKLSELGMQNIMKSEIFMTSDDSDWDNDFAYTPRYEEQKMNVNRDNGSLVSDLRYMVASRRFNSAPTFNDPFLRVLPNYNNLNRTFNVVSDLPDDTPLFMDLNLKITANRQLPYYGLPKY